jgi:hypothetical protein
VEVLRHFNERICTFPQNLLLKEHNAFRLTKPSSGARQIITDKIQAYIVSRGEEKEGDIGVGGIQK